MTDDMKKLRDEMAEKYYNEQLENGELNSRHMDSADVAFCKGFDSAYTALAEKLAEAEKEITRLKEFEFMYKELCK
jgi:hypothetical protein